MLVISHTTTKETHNTTKRGNRRRKKMGKRKSKRKPQSTNKRKQTLDKTFTCPFCSFPKAVECTMQRELGYAVVECRNCRAKYSTKINSKCKGDVSP